MIDHEDLYRNFIISHGVAGGKPEGSYVSRLKRASRVLRVRISPKVLRSSADITRFVVRLSSTPVPPKAISDIRSAMRQYVDMVASLGLYPVNPAGLTPDATSESS